MNTEIASIQRTVWIRKCHEVGHYVNQNLTHKKYFQTSTNFPSYLKDCFVKNLVSLLLKQKGKP
jgi:hypothetical protein